MGPPHVVLLPMAAARRDLSRDWIPGSYESRQQETGHSATAKANVHASIAAGRKMRKLTRNRVIASLSSSRDLNRHGMTSCTWVHHVIGSGGQTPGPP